jgi:hypothetical protein
MPDPASGLTGVYAGDEEPRRRVEFVNSPFRAAIESKTTAEAHV